MARDQLGGLVGVARVQHGAAVHRAERRQVLQAHLGGPVLADGDARVRADQVDLGPADRGHPDEVVGAGEEGGEGARRTAIQPRAAMPDGGGDHLLLGDVALEEPLRVRLGEGLRPGGVAHLAVEGDDVAARACRARPAPRRRRSGWPPASPVS